MINGRKELTYWQKYLKTSDRCNLERKETAIKISRNSKNAGKTNSKKLKNSNRLYSQNLNGKTNLDCGSSEKQTVEMKACK